MMLTIVRDEIIYLSTTYYFSQEGSTPNGKLMTPLNYNYNSKFILWTYILWAGLKFKNYVQNVGMSHYFAWKKGEKKLIYKKKKIFFLLLCLPRLFLFLLFFHFLLLFFIFLIWCNKNTMHYIFLFFSLLWNIT